MIIGSNDFFRVLSAEDDFDDQVLIEEAINMAGIKAEIDFVQHGEALIKKLINGSCPDIVYVISICQEWTIGKRYMKLRNQLKLNDIPIVVLTTSKDHFEE